MYRVALAVLLPLALLDLASGCPPAPHRDIFVNGVKVREYYCDGGKVLYMHENVYRCFERHFQCPNGFWHENKCHCFPGTNSPQPGVCGQICPNCQNGWCYSSSKCMCNDGYQMINGLCTAPPPPPPPPQPPTSANFPPWWPPTNQYNYNQYPYWYPGPMGYPDPNTGSDPSKASNPNRGSARDSATADGPVLDGRMGGVNQAPQRDYLPPPWGYPPQANHY